MVHTTRFIWIIRLFPQSTCHLKKRHGYNIYTSHESFALSSIVPFQIVYNECLVILFSVKTRLDSCEHREILLNPVNNCTIKEEDFCVYLCESSKDVNNLVCITIKVFSAKPFTSVFLDKMKERRQQEASRSPRQNNTFASLKQPSP